MNFSFLPSHLRTGASLRFPPPPPPLFPPPFFFFSRLPAKRSWKGWPFPREGESTGPFSFPFFPPLPFYESFWRTMEPFPLPFCWRTRLIPAFPFFPSPPEKQRFGFCSAPPTRFAAVARETAALLFLLSLRPALVRFFFFFLSGNSFFLNFLLATSLLKNRTVLSFFLLPSPLSSPPSFRNQKPERAGRLLSLAMQGGRTGYDFSFPPFTYLSQGMGRPRLWLFSPDSFGNYYARALFPLPFFPPPFFPLPTRKRILDTLRGGDYMGFPPLIVY